jgi:tRNA(Ile)-lysidine synthase TilS/MesJ
MSMQRVETNSHLIDGTIIRPLLTLSKSYIQHICDTHRIQYIYDNTNEDINISKRNKLRHTILASLKELSHKNAKEYNSFEQSMYEIYTAIESKQEDNHPIDLVKIPMYIHWEIKRAYRWDSNQTDITTHTIKKLCKQLHIQNNMDKKYIKELTVFLQNKNK